MKYSTASQLTSAALLSAAAAGDSSWIQWSSSSPAPAPAPAPVTWTDWVTSVETVYSTIDNYITVTYTPAPVTVTQIVKETDVSVSVSGSVATVVDTVTNVPPPMTIYVTSVAVSVSVSVSVSSAVTTVTDTITDTVTSVSLTTTTESALNGLVTCPSRIINPTYTPPGPLPTDYLWGCPVGTLCKPPRIGCNFEQNPPADTYFCSPEECEPIVPLPPFEAYDTNEDVNGTCAWLTPIDDYFNLNPTFFGLNFGIFNIYGQPTCSVVPTSTVYITLSTTVVSGTTSLITVPTTIIEDVPTTVVNTVVSTQVNNVPVPTTLISNVPVPTTIVNNVPVPTTVLQPTTVVVTEWSNVPVYETVTASSSWGAWNSKVTKRAEVEERDLEKRLALVDPKCYTKCNYANMAYQNTHLGSALCNPTGGFIVAFNAFTDCTSSHPASTAGTAAAVLYSPVSYCGLHLKRSAAPEPEPSAPVFRFARG